MPVFAADEGLTLALEEIVVTARRKDESLQDVPLTVNVVTADALDDLNIRKFEDLEGVVAGLSLAEDNIGPSASMRGVDFNTYASGFNSTVEFYLNDAPIVSLAVMQAMFDVGQIEVLRGPQGTLRGRASPSGSITITAKKPQLEEFGGYVDVTGTDHSGYNVRAAVNVPVIEDKLAFRFAGFQESNDANDVKSITSGEDSDYKGTGWRASMLFQPTEDLTINLMHQQMNPKRTTVSQVESAYLADSAITPSGTLIKAEDRKGVMDRATSVEHEFVRTGLEVGWVVGDFSLNYAGAINAIDFDLHGSQDPTDAFDTYYDLSQPLSTYTDDSSHEIRFASEEPLFDGLMDFIVGGFYQHIETGSDLTNPTVIVPSYIYTSNIERRGESEEQSLFANATFYLGEDTEFSVGGRHINYQTDSSLNVIGSLYTESDNEWSEDIYSASLKHQFTDGLMAYVTYGSSFRPGVEVVGVFTPTDAAMDGYLSLPPETSDSYEVGFKSSWLNNTLRVNTAAYYQEFDNYPYRTPSGVWYVAGAGVSSFNFVAPVPVEVTGVEVETFYQISDSWDVSALISWSEGKIQNGQIPCNDPYNGSVPSAADILAASGGDQIASCTASIRSNTSPQLTATLMSEYSFPVADFDGYVRGMLTHYGDSQSDPTNAIDDVDAYEMVNFYAGLREGEGKWEVMFYGKNIFNTERVLSRGPSAGVVPVQFGADLVSDYREITMTAAREFGVNVRYNF
ncbi:TonB-dependent receptor [Aestuariicella hydrocarbonica]|uniref:TonB-dependent receptor n=1 Tax=Pseudomaricurvus hydrocarbonicus TaxID=1470433 RepID=A0A9E5JUM7_9GAMM|nr:TonB-dependent receptor [Aestuariicella hydrocarbonica]